MVDAKSTNEVAVTAKQQYFHSTISPVPLPDKKIEKYFPSEGTSIDEEKGIPVSVSKLSASKDGDPNIVDWDGPHDPEKAMNWTPRKKWTMTFLLSTLTLLTYGQIILHPSEIKLTTSSPMASSMFAPSVEAVLKEFYSSSADLGTFIVSSYLLGYAFGPLFIAPMSETYGRLPVYHISTLGFILFNVACAKSTNFPMIIVFRIMSRACGCTPLTLGPGSISDMFKQEVRGKILSIWVLPIMLGPAVGPIAGGYLSEAKGWRWDFWFLVILVRIVLPHRLTQLIDIDQRSVYIKSRSPARDKSHDNSGTS
jgi:multidrug resistance protein